MGLSLGMIRSQAKAVAEPAMEHMLNDLAESIRGQVRRVDTFESGRVLNLVAESIEKIDVSKYF